MHPESTIKPEPLIIAHRGESHLAPENTLASVNLAWERGACAVEVDVHMTSDGEVAVIHDRNTFRTTGVRHHVNHTPLAALQRLDAGSWKGAAWKGEKIPSLKDVLAVVPVRGRMVIEMKSGAGMPDTISRIIRESRLRNDQVEIISFDFRLLSEAKRRMPEHRMLWVIESRSLWRQFATGHHPKAVLRRLDRHGVDGTAVGDSRHLNRQFIRQMTVAGRPLYVWTVNDPGRAAQLLELGATGITTDRAGWLSGLLGEGNAE